MVNVVLFVFLRFHREGFSEVDRGMIKDKWKNSWGFQHHLYNKHMKGEESFLF
jgi:hypothetical protein